MTRARDCYLTPPPVCEAVRSLRGWIDLDPFHHPDSHVGADCVIDERAGGDGFAVSWVDHVMHHRRERYHPKSVEYTRPIVILANGPYSGRNPARWIAKCEQEHLAGWLRPLEIPPVEVVAIAPAAIGSVYWRRHVWERSIVSFLGRLPFVAGEDLRSREGRLVQEKGTMRKGSDTDIAAIYWGDTHHLFARRFRALGTIAASVAEAPAAA